MYSGSSLDLDVIAVSNCYNISICITYRVKIENMMKFIEYKIRTVVEIK